MERQKPVDDRRAETYGELWAIITHPAFRLGFLDASAGRPVNHDTILARIERETPTGALRRLGWAPSDGLSFWGTDGATRVAQYRYEEGRLLFLDIGLRCKAWGHHDFPPAAVRRFVEARTKSSQQAA